MKGTGNSGDKIKNKQKTKKMRKLILTGALGVVGLLTVSCGGGGHSCDAYRSADYTQYKVKKEIKINFEKLVSLKKK